MPTPRGSLTLEALERARQTFREQILPDGSRLRLGQRVDILPSPRSDGEVVFGQSLREYRAAIIDGLFQWVATGKTAVDYWGERRR